MHRSVTANAFRETQAFCKPCSSRRQVTLRCRAVKFQPLYEELRVASRDDERPLPNESLTDLIDTVKDAKHAKLLSELVVNDVSKRLSRSQKDWPFRRRLYALSAAKLVEVGADNVLIDMLRQADLIAVEKYFVADLICELGIQDADLVVLEGLLEVQREYTQNNANLIKGLRRAYWELLKTCDARKQHEKMGALYMRAKADGVTFSEAFTKKLESLASSARTSAQNEELQSASAAPVAADLVTTTA